MELDLDAVGKAIEAPPFAYDWKTCATYALGIGAGPDELAYTWEKAPHFKVAPSFAVVPTMPIVMDALARVRADFRTLVHGAQTLTLHAPIPKQGTLHSEGRIREVLDKGKGAVVIIETNTRDADGKALFDTEWSIFCRGQGGFGGPRGESEAAPEAKAGAAPAFEDTLQTAPNQALIYRLSGDLNPLHVDPALATKVGFEGPILHGLCTYGFAVRAVLRRLCDDDPARLASFTARFSQVVYPGDALTVRALPAAEDGVYLLEAAVGDRTVLSNGVVRLR